MIRISIASIILSSNLAYSQAADFNPSDWKYTLAGCTSEDVCEEVFDSGTLQDLIVATAEQMRTTKQPTNGKGTNGLAQGLSTATGMVLGAVKTAVNGMKDAAVAAGFDTFTGTLSGPSGSITFKMHLATGAWSFWGSSETSSEPGPERELMPSPGQN